MTKKNLPHLCDRGLSTDKRWYIEYADETGKIRRKYGNINQYKTVKERQAAAQVVLKTLKSQSITIESAKVIRKLREEFEIKKTFWRPSTLRARSSKLRILLEWMQGHPNPWSSTSVQEFFTIHLIRERKLHPTTYNDYLIGIRQFLEWIDLKHLADGLEKQKAIVTPARYYTETQRRYLMKCFREVDPELAIFVGFVYYCFIRPRAELRLLKISDVLLEDHKIMVPSTKAKNKKQEYVVIPDPFFDEVKQLVEDRAPTEYLFPGQGGPFTPMGRNTMGRRHRALLKELHFDTNEYKLYSWKHSGAVAAAMAGIPIKQLQIQLRHHSLDQVDEYLRQLGVSDIHRLQSDFPAIL